MSLHGLLSVTIGVPNVEETAAYYTEFGLARQADGWFSTLFAWGPPPPPSFMYPDDLAAMMTGAHSAR
jgi:catechol 2,3-dioxygenase-like lactoylglutathione lyase family enzyme